MTEIQARLAEINKRVAPIFEEHVRLTDAVNKAIVLIWIGAAVFFGCMLAEPQFKSSTLDQQESSYVAH